MNKFSSTNIISRNPDVAYAQIDNDLVMMGPKDDLFYGINPTGTVIWSLLEFNSLPFSTICESILQNYDVTETVCIEDTAQFIQAMIDQNMLVVLE